MRFETQANQQIGAGLVPESFWDREVTTYSIDSTVLGDFEIKLANFKRREKTI